jgi:ABC-type transport system involved in multi-copper enzyme maturation permease subunit
MNPQVLKALVLDALYQVLDNSVFRILVMLTAVPVLGTVLIQFQEQDLAVLFGVWSWSYEDIVGGFGVPMEGGMDLRVLFIEGYHRIVVMFLGGTIGVLFCVAATSFFVPRMIEKGAADILFHKPISRLLLFLSRYLSGLIFVGILATVMVSGVYLGLFVVSQHHDPGILWAAPTMVYMFGLVYSVAMLIGVLTRSTVASILLTVLFFFGNGCVHQIWEGVDQAREMSSLLTNQEAESEEDEEDDESPAIFGFLKTSLDVLHFTLPKTGDADRIAANMRKAFSNLAFEDRETGFRIEELPAELDEISGREVAESVAPSPLAERFGEILYAAEGGGDRELRLWRRDTRRVEHERPNGEIRERRERLRDAAEWLEEVIAAEPDGPEIDTGPLDMRFSESSSRGSFEKPDPEEDGESPEAEVLEPRVPFQNLCLSWSDRGEQGPRENRILLFRAKDWTYTLEYRTGVTEASPGDSPDASPAEFAAICEKLRFDPQSDPYGRQFGVNAPLKYNLLFSVGSSLAFALLMLLIGWWRLCRIDF